MTKTKKSWIQKHINDPYVIQAQKEGWRSRAVFKLKEVQLKDKVIKPGMRIVDLGAAPGGWSQYAAHCLNGKGHIVAIDLLPMDTIAGVEFIQGDFRDEETLKQLMAAVGHEPIDLVMSDMAPNFSGHKGIDQPRSMHLAELALAFAEDVLSDKGQFLIKLFQGTEIDQYIQTCRERFKRVTIRKPKASRDKSREFYLLAQR